jgi:hypothetical protein
LKCIKREKGDFKRLQETYTFTDVIDVALEEYILPKLQDTSQFLQESDRKSTYHSSDLTNLLHVLIGPMDLIVKAYV